MNSPDAFWTPFQDAPLDLDFTPDFYVQRKEAIQQRLSEVCTMTREALCAAILESYEAHFGQVMRDSLLFRLVVISRCTLSDLSRHVMDDLLSDSSAHCGVPWGTRLGSHI